jgi:hypothetical protein
MLPPIGFNNTLAMFPPKGDEEADSDEILREACDTRPLGMKNCDNKTVAGVYNAACKRTLSASANRLQRGFIAGRQIIQNVMNMDTHARIFGRRGHCDFVVAESNGALPLLPGEGGRIASKMHGMATLPLELLCPLLAFFDFAAAFPSVLHSWLFLSLEACGAPDGFVKVIAAMYRCVSTYTVVEGCSHFMFWVLSGVLQGCPLSGMLFAIALNPFLNKFDKELDSPGVACVRACADDIGVAIRGIATLALLKPTFDSAKAFAGLTLKPRKCVLVPTSQQLTPNLEKRIKCWLGENLHDWMDFLIKPRSLYLGFYLGPTAQEIQFDKVHAKWTQRANAIAARHASAAVSAHLYNTRAVPVLGYLAQLAIPPETLFRAERQTVLHIFHMATNSLDDAAVHCLPNVGGPRVRSIRALSIATLARTAFRTISEWKEDLHALQSVSEADPCDLLSRGQLWAKCWDSPAIASLLAHVASGTVYTKRDSIGLPAASIWIRKAQQISAAVSKITSRGLLVLEADLRFLLQKALYEAVHTELHVDMLIPLFERRLRTVFAPLLIPLPVIPWTEIRAILNKVGIHVAMTIIKTWAGSWCTSTRYHDGRCAYCIFGCGYAGDQIVHYISCPWLWTAVDVATGLDEEEIDTASQRLLLVGPSPTRAKRLTIAYSVYHAIKLDNLEEVQRAEASRDYSIVREKTDAAARAFAIKFYSASP